MFEIVGTIAGILTTIASLPQIIKILRTKSSTDISKGTYTLLLTGTIIWLIYGILIKSIPLIIFNAITFIEGMLILYLCRNKKRRIESVGRVQREG
jgi:MtN3 and saliva related transmembrane protein